MKTIYFLLFYIVVTNTFSQVLNIELLDNWDNNSLEVIDDGESVFNECWGFVQDGQEYALIGSTAGTHFFKITNNDNLDFIHFKEGKSHGSHMIHRDYHDYNGYLYEVADEGFSALRIYDLQFLPDSLPIIYETNSLIGLSHNIFIDSSSKILYSCESSYVNTFSLADPRNPVYSSYINGLNFAHDIYVRNDTSYVNAIDEGFSIQNIYDSSFQYNYDAIADVPYYNDQGVNHSGWLSKDGNIYIFCDETPGAQFKICDVSDMNNIEVVAYAKPPTFENTMAHNVMIRDSFAYFSYYNDGLQVYDISTPSNPIRVAYYDTYDGLDSFSGGGAWGIYALLPSERILVSDRKNGLFLLKNSLLTSVEDLTKKHDLKNHILYPNPIIDFVTIEFTLPITSKYQIQIYGPTGNLIDSFNSKKQILILNTKKYAKGNYTYSIKSNNIITNGKFIKI